MTTPKYSIIIPSYGRIDKLIKCLKSLKENTYNNYEIIVINDCYKDFPDNRIKEVIEARVEHLEKKSGPAYARNFGAKISAGSILIFLDSDVYVRPDTLSEINRQFVEKNDLDVVQCVYSGKCLNKNASSLYKHLLQVLRINSLSEEDYVIGSSCLAVKKEIFFLAKGFPEYISYQGNEDRAFGHTLLKNKARLYFAREIQVEHDRYFSLKTLLYFDIKRTISELQFIFHTKNQIFNMLTSKKSYIKLRDICVLKMVFLQLLFIVIARWGLFGISLMVFVLLNMKLFSLWFQYDKNILKQYLIIFIDNTVMMLTGIICSPVILIKTKYFQKDRV